MIFCRSWLIRYCHLRMLNSAVFLLEMQRRSTHIYIGRDAQTTMHFHAGDESISSVIQGRKEFILFPPSETKYLSPFPLHAVGRLNQSRLELWRNEAINHANLDRAHGYKCELGP